MIARHLLFMLVLLNCAIAQAYGSLGTSPPENHHVGVQVIDTQGLQNLQTQKASFILLDARSEPYFDGTVIVGAQWLPMDAPDEKITRMLPDKNKTIVVYCAGKGCPASEILSQRLAKAGYMHVFEYPDGIRVWAEKGLPTEKTP